MSGEHVAIHAARQRRQKLESEEEEMTRYTRGEIEDGWEFKVVRSYTGAFGKPGALQSLMEQEAIAGWEMVEKFDDNRVRFKRPTSARRKDEMLPPGFDPYRTQYGLSEAGLAFVIMGVVAGLVILGLVIASLRGGL